MQEFSAGLNTGSVPQIIETGSDGGMWFSDNGTPSAVGRIDPTTHVIQEFSTGMTPGAAPNGITLGADGNIWVVETGTGGIGSITPAGTISEYPVGVASAIASGADGNLWFGTTGAVGQFGIGAPAASVTAPAVTGSDGVGVPQNVRGRHVVDLGRANSPHTTPTSPTATTGCWTASRSSAQTRSRTHPRLRTPGTSSPVLQLSPTRSCR